MSITSNPEQFKTLSTNPNHEPFVMLNLLKFKNKDGEQLYARYMREAAPFVRDVGAKVIYLGVPRELLNGEERWDLLMLVEYPSRQAFLKMTSDPDYLKVHQFREQALERAVLYATDPVRARALAGDG